MRGAVAESIWPTVAELMLATGLLKLAWFNVLNISARN